jgi:hypothetical protein
LAIFQAYQMFIHKIYQMSIIHIIQMAIENTNLFHSKALQNVPNFGLLVWKRTIWQPCWAVAAHKRLSLYEYSWLFNLNMTWLCQMPSFVIRYRVARFFLVQLTKTGKHTKWSKTIPNSRKIFRIAVKWTKRTLNIPTFSIARPSKIDPNWDFWFENKPSGKRELMYKHSSNVCT